MKSRNFIERFVFVVLLAAAFFIVSCGSSDKEKEDSPDTDTSDSGITDDGDTDTAADSGDTSYDSGDTTQENPDTTPDDSDSADTANDDDTSDSGTNDDGSDTADETDTDFEKEAEGCTMIEVPKITIGGAYADEVDGYFSPAMGDANIDYIHIYLYNRVEGEYELGTGKNATYANCSECVIVTVDEAEAVANEYYFQTSGTLKITKVATVDEVERTSGEIRNLILKQAEPVDHFEDMEFIDNGKCVAAKIIEWDTTGGSGY